MAGNLKNMQDTVAKSREGGIDNEGFANPVYFQ